jgi:hypothetical protein
LGNSEKLNMDALLHIYGVHETSVDKIMHKFNFENQGISMWSLKFCRLSHRAAAHQLRQDKHQSMRQKKQKLTSAS